MSRPFYLVGHNTNSIGEVREALDRGLNAVELDVNVDERNQLYISHDRVASIPRGLPLPPRLVPFLSALKQLIAARPPNDLALVMFDCKISAPALAEQLLADIRRELTDHVPSLQVILSVSSIERAHDFFGRIQHRLTPFEALMIDEESDPGKVSRFFSNVQVERAGYGNGIATVAGIGLPFSPFLPAQMDVAVAFRAVLNLRFVYPWVLVEASTMREFMRIGVNAIMVDTGNAGTLNRVLAEPEFHGVLHKALRTDDPLAQDSSLLLQVKTKDQAQAGTDARVTFELTDAQGARLSRSVDGGFNGRFERGATTCVTFVGAAQRPRDIRSISVSHDGSRNAPDWFLESITLRRRGEDDLRVEFGVEVSQGHPATRLLP